jgi:hypothetical protein
MEMTEMESLWRDVDQKLDRTIRLNRQLLVAGKLGEVKTPLRQLVAALAFEAAAAVCVLLALGSFLYAHAGEPRYAWPAAMLHVWAIGALAGTIGQLVLAIRINYEQPVVEIQRRIAELRLVRLRVIRWALATGLVVWWLPLLVVACKGFFGLDAYHVFGLRFFYINGLASGLAVPFAILLAGKVSRGVRRSDFVRELARHMEGGYVTRAEASMQAIVFFASESWL